MRRRTRAVGDGRLWQRTSARNTSATAAAASPSQEHDPLAPQRRHHSHWSYELSTCGDGGARPHDALTSERLACGRVLTGHEERQGCVGQSGERRRLTRRVEAALVDHAAERASPAKVRTGSLLQRSLHQRS